jgi:hypothetical protein
MCFGWRGGPCAGLDPTPHARAVAVAAAAGHPALRGSSAIIVCLLAGSVNDLENFFFTCSLSCGCGQSDGRNDRSPSIAASLDECLLWRLSCRRSLSTFLLAAGIS